MNEKLFLKKKIEILNIDKRKIVFIESCKGLCTIHTKKQLIEIRYSLKELEKILGNQFVRVHKSYLVNIMEIERIKSVNKDRSYEINFYSYDKIALMSRYRYKLFLGHINNQNIQANELDLSIEKYSAFSKSNHYPFVILTVNEGRYIDVNALNTHTVGMSINTFKDGKILGVNKAFCNILGYEQSELWGRTFDEIGFWVDSDEPKSIVLYISAGESVHHREIRFYRKTREYRCGLYSAEKIELDKKPCILSTLIDISESKTAKK